MNPSETELDQNVQDWVSNRLQGSGSVYMCLFYLFIFCGFIELFKSLHELFPEPSRKSPVSFLLPPAAETVLSFY